MRKKLEYPPMGSRPDGKKTALTVFFFVVLNLLTEGFQWFYFREGLSFSRGSNFFQEWGGPNVNFYRNPYITCDFLSPPPLWIRACIITFIHPVHPC